jgi:diketogulonate reductase-like aldo/keto reductase
MAMASALQPAGSMAQTSTTVRRIALPSGEAVPALGQGTWAMGEKRKRRGDEVAALRLGLDLGMTLIDTAEMYASGGAEEIVGEAIAGRRDDVFLVSKVLPSHARRRETIAACRASIRRLRVEQIDLYLLHWREDVPLEETLEGFEALMQGGEIRRWGVSNFDVDDINELIELHGGDAVATNQVLYNLTRRGIENGVLPSCRERKIPVMAYSPIEQARLTNNAALERLGARIGATPSQIAIAWVLRQPDVIAIPKASNPDHVRDNRAALDLRLSDDDLRELDRAFPPPSKRVPLEVL